MSPKGTYRVLECICGVVVHGSMPLLQWYGRIGSHLMKECKLVSKETPAYMRASVVRDQLGEFTRGKR